MSKKDRRGYMTTAATNHSILDTITLILVTNISLSDYTRLEVLMRTLTGSREAVAELARRKLASAIVSLPTDMPLEAVTVGMHVRFRVDGGVVKDRLLVWHTGGEHVGDVISCVELVGLAPLGLTPFQAMNYRHESGITHSIMVENVAADSSETSNRSVDAAHSRMVSVAAVIRASLWRHLKDTWLRWQRSRKRSVLERPNDNLMADIGMKRHAVDSVAASSVNMCMSHSNHSGHSRSAG